MVNAFVRSICLVTLALSAHSLTHAQEPVETPLQEHRTDDSPSEATNSTKKKKKLDGPTRARVLAALGAFLILGFGMISLTWLGARITRRYMQTDPRPPSDVVAQLRGERWAKPIRIDDPHE